MCWGALGATRTPAKKCFIFESRVSGKVRALSFERMVDAEVHGNRRRETAVRRRRPGSAEGDRAPDREEAARGHLLILSAHCVTRKSRGAGGRYGPPRTAPSTR